jgi:hypothetical protein
MSRPATGDGEVLMNSREAIAAAQTVEQLRQAQSIVLPLDYASFSQRSSTLATASGCSMGAM